MRRPLLAFLFVVAACTSTPEAAPLTTTTEIPPVPSTTTSTTTTTTTSTTTTTTTIPDITDCGPSYECDNVALLSVMSIEQLGGVADADFVSDMWGWADADTGTEVAIVSLARGTAFVDVTDPEAPTLIGVLPLPDATEVVPLQDIKVYDDHAFIVGESLNHGMQVVDLQSVVAEGLVEEVARYAGVSSAHNLAINEATGYAYVLGSNECLGGLHMVDVSTPSEPTEAGCFDGDGYVHDAQCVLYQGPDQDYAGQELCFGSNEDTLTIVDVTDKTAPILISRTGYDEASYSHQGWLTHDASFFMLGDEIDELEFEVNTRTIVFEIGDLDSPEWIGNFVDELAAINHNIFIVADRMFQANYTAGLRIFDVTDPARLDYELVAFIDTHPDSDAADFAGAFSVYPYFPSGTVAISDISEGLILINVGP